MKKSIKALLTVVCCLTLVIASIVGTLAYMTDRDEVVNTFTVGNVTITLDEAKVDDQGKAEPSGDRVAGNEYHLIPGKTYDKDPTLTVKKGSEESYVRMLVTINEIGDLKKAFGDDFAPETLLNVWGAGWSYKGVYDTSVTDTVTYEYRYNGTVSAKTEEKKLAPLFQTLTLPGNITGDQLNDIAGLEITVEGHAIQAEGFADADAAWNAFKAQNG